MRPCRGVVVTRTRSMSPANPSLLDEAATWVVRTRDPAFRDWETFTLWLEADPARNEAYGAALDAHDAAGLLVNAPVEPAEPVVLAGRRRWPFAGAAMAAALAGVIGTPFLLDRHDRYTVATGAGEQRAVRLPDGSVIAMNGDTRITLDRKAPRLARLDAGEASFSIVHDDADPFVVEAGGTKIQDVGTTFNVVRHADATDVAVARGAVVYDPKGAGVKLTAGRTLHDPDRGPIEIGDAPREAIGAWRRGRLIYRDAPLGVVAGDLARATGDRIVLDPALAARSFTGTIELRGVDRAQLPGRLARLAGARAQHVAGGWRLMPEGGIAR